MSAPPGGQIDILKPAFIRSVRPWPFPVSNPPSRWRAASFRGNVERGDAVTLAESPGRLCSCHMVPMKQPAPGGLGSRMVAGSTHTPIYIAKQDRSGSRVRPWRCVKRKGVGGTRKSDGDKVKQPIRKISIGAARGAAIQLLSPPRLNY